MSEEIEISEEERSVSENSPRDVNDSTYIYDSSSSHEDSNQSVCESDNESSLDSILENDAQNLDDLGKRIRKPVERFGHALVSNQTRFRPPEDRMMPVSAHPIACTARTNGGGSLATGI
ncbi:hypothetical protein ACJJTC_009584 [Scirpophaga incertulas]